MAVRAVFFDVGETLVDETRHWSQWADWLGVPRFTFFAVLGAVIARGEHHRRAFDYFQPGFDLEKALEQRRAEGWRYTIEQNDLYPDVQPCLTLLRDQKYILGIAGNQLVEAKASLRALELPADIVATSASWGVEKPSPGFYARLLGSVGELIEYASPSEVAYVGDHPQNDVAAAAEAGLTAIFIRRGPWAAAHADSAAARRASIRIDGLYELPRVLQAFAG